MCTVYSTRIISIQILKGEDFLLSHLNYFFLHFFFFLGSWVCAWKVLICGNFGGSLFSLVPCFCDYLSIVLKVFLFIFPYGMQSVLVWFGGMPSNSGSVKETYLVSTLQILEWCGVKFLFCRHPLPLVENIASKSQILCFHRGGRRGGVVEQRWK